MTRISKILAHYELFKMTSGLPGTIMEFGVFKGASLARFAMLRELLESPASRPIVGFDIFDAFPETGFEDDQRARQDFIDRAGSQSIGREQLEAVLRQKRTDRDVTLVEGDVTVTLPAYVGEHPELRVSLVNLDTDVYEPAVTVLEHMWPRLVVGGVMILDDYGTFAGETQAVDEYFAGTGTRIQKFPFATTPAYIVKEIR